MRESFAEILDVFFNGRKAHKTEGVRVDMADYPRTGHMWMRPLMQEINAEFARILIAYEEIGVGKEPLDGTGDTMQVALKKIRDNLRKIRP